MSLETPNKIRELQRKLYRKAKEEPDYRFYLLYSVLHSLWGFPPERFTSQAFWDCFDQIESAAPTAADQLQQAQTRLLGAWKDKQLISRRLLAYDTTNFHTYIASTNQRNQLAQRGHHKQGRHNLRQVGLSYVLDGESGLSLCHHVYPGNLADANELPVALERIGSMLDEQSIARDAVTLVLDKGSAYFDMGGSGSTNYPF